MQSEKPTPMPPRLRFPRTRRVLRKADFERAMRTGLRLVDERLMIWFVLNGLPASRLGLVVGRRHGGAVQRNRLKRRIREAFRLSQHALPVGLDVIVSPKSGVPLEVRSAAETLVRLAERAARRLGPAGADGS